MNCIDNEKIDNEIKFNEFKIRENNEKIKMLEKNSVVGKTECFVRTFTPSYILFCLINLIGITFIPSFIIIMISSLIGTITTLSIYNKKDYKKKLRSFTKAKKEKELVEERIILESEIRYLEMKNRALKLIRSKRLEDIENDECESLESIDKEMNKITTKMILNEIFSSYRKDEDKVLKDTVFYFSIGVVIFFLLYNIPIALSHMPSEINIFNIFVPSFLFTLGINRYEVMLKKIYKKINSSLDSEVIPRYVSEDEYNKCKLKKLINNYANKYMKSLNKPNTPATKHSDNKEKRESTSNIEYLNGPRRKYEMTNNRD